MSHRLLQLLVSGAIACAPASAADIDRDGMDDELRPSGSSPSRAGATVAVVDAWDFADTYALRLGGLGYGVTMIPPESGYDVLVDYALVVLPVGHASQVSRAALDSLATDYHAYVAQGGALWVSQPNPYNTGGVAEITWVPYALTVENGYTLSDCPPVIADPDHCITTGLPDEQFSMPADQIAKIGPEWHVVVEGATTGDASVFLAEYEEGLILVELGHPGGQSYCPVSQTVYERYASCLLDPPLPVEPLSWGAIKTRYSE